MEKYSSGRRGVPAKDVGRVYPAREFKSLLLRQKSTSVARGLSIFLFDFERKDNSHLFGILGADFTDYG